MCRTQRVTARELVRMPSGCSDASTHANSPLSGFAANSDSCLPPSPSSQSRVRSNSIVQAYFIEELTAIHQTRSSNSPSDAFQSTIKALETVQRSPAKFVHFKSSKKHLSSGLSFGRTYASKSSKDLTYLMYTDAAYLALKE
eukprot:CAMPEP_0196735260 /NCGR_PEP_ID=MMETSP1091-20130531/13763_1 /TAXON_ID=302021 /ORGANISM="Rhodomonas sp., Strain CCMP768" /LENGTH=141 /DNA_ID=CAMNT_0042078883 /DNA_START=50 /DNA_END=475 /DNA_ORIENTATION=+